MFPVSEIKTFLGQALRRHNDKYIRDMRVRDIATPVLYVVMPFSNVGALSASADASSSPMSALLDCIVADFAVQDFAVIAVLKNRPKKMERATGFEPATFSLGS